jgi:hypothetical protein
MNNISHKEDSKVFLRSLKKKKQQQFIYKLQKMLKILNIVIEQKNSYVRVLLVQD